MRTLLWYFNTECNAAVDIEHELNFEKLTLLHHSVDSVDTSTKNVNISNGRNSQRNWPLKKSECEKSLIPTTSGLKNNSRKLIRPRQRNTKIDEKSQSVSKFLIHIVIFIVFIIAVVAIIFVWKKEVKYSMVKEESTIVAKDHERIE